MLLKILLAAFVISPSCAWAEAYIPIIAAEDLRNTKFVESLAYLFFVRSTETGRAPADGPNLFGCSVNLTKVDYCNAMAASYKEKSKECPPMVHASKHQENCDLQQDAEYVLDGKPILMGLKVKSLPGVERVTFKLKYVTGTEKNPNYNNLMEDGVPWKMGRVALAVDLGLGQLLDGKGNEVAKFHLTYDIKAAADPKAHGIVTCEAGPKCQPGPQSGHVDMQFPNGAKLKEDFVLKGEAKR